MSAIAGFRNVEESHYSSLDEVKGETDSNPPQSSYVNPLDDEVESLVKGKFRDTTIMLFDRWCLGDKISFIDLLGVDLFSSLGKLDEVLQEQAVEILLDSQLELGKQENSLSQSRIDGIIRRLNSLCTQIEGLKKLSKRPETSKNKALQIIELFIHFLNSDRAFHFLMKNLISEVSFKKKERLFEGSGEKKRKDLIIFIQYFLKIALVKVSDKDLKETIQELEKELLSSLTRDKGIDSQSILQKSIEATQQLMSQHGRIELRLEKSTSKRGRSQREYHQLLYSHISIEFMSDYLKTIQKMVIPEGVYIDLIKAVGLISEHTCQSRNLIDSSSEFQNFLEKITEIIGIRRKVEKSEELVAADPTETYPSTRPLSKDLSQGKPQTRKETNFSASINQLIDYLGTLNREEIQNLLDREVQLHTLEKCTTEEYFHLILLYLMREYIFVLLGIQKEGRFIEEIISEKILDLASESLLEDSANDPVVSEPIPRSEPVAKPIPRSEPVAKPIPRSEPVAGAVIQSNSESEVFDSQLAIRAMKYRTLVKILEKFEFRLVRSKKHDIFKHPKISGSVTVPRHERGGRTVPKGTVKSIKEQAMEQLRQLDKRV